MQQSIGYVVAYSTAAANAKGVSLNNERGSITQQLAQYFFEAPTAEMIEAECAAITLGYADAASKGFKVGKHAAAVMQSQFRKLGAAQRGEVKHGLTDSPVTVTFKADESDGTIIAFGHGSISKEYAAINAAQRTAIERVAALDAQVRDAEQAHAEFLADAKRNRAELLALVK